MELTASKTASCTIVTYRAWPNGPLGLVVFTAIRFQSRTASALATAGRNSRVAIKMHRPRFLFVTSLCIAFIVLPPVLTAFGQCGDNWAGSQSVSEVAFPRVAGGTSTIIAVCLGKGWPWCVLVES